jgi:hypothetical protein
VPADSVPADEPELPLAAVVPVPDEAEPELAEVLEDPPPEAAGAAADPADDVDEAAHPAVRAAAASRGTASSFLFMRSPVIVR